MRKFNDVDGVFECVASCDEGYVSNNGVCVKCQEDCKTCRVTSSSVNGLSVQSTICLECSNLKYLNGVNGCVEECPSGYFEEEFTGWCVKCACNCDECEGNKYFCTDCKANSFFSSDKCFEEAEEIPVAKFNDDWKSFTITYTNIGFYNGFSSSFGTSSTGSI